MRAVVTGAAGFVGSTLVDRLLADGHQVIGIDNLRTGALGNLESARRRNEENRGRFRLIPLDIQAPELVGIVAGANPDVIFHLAAQVDHQASVEDPQLDARSNILGTINVCEATRRSGVRRVVYAACEESSHDPSSPYAVAKRSGEMYLRAYADMYDLSPMCLALSDVYGPRQNPHASENLVASIADAMMTGSPFSLQERGIQARDYIYIDDVVDAFVRAACAPTESAGTYRIGTGQHRTVTELHGVIAAVLNGDPHPAIAAKSSTVEHEFGWEPAVDIYEGIQRTVCWLRGVSESAVTMELAG